MNGFSLFANRHNHGDNEYQIYEKLIGFHIPPMFKKFLSYFVLGENGLIGVNYKSASQEIEFPIASIKFKLKDQPVEISCDEIFNCESLIRDWSLTSATEEFQEHGLIRIGSIGRGGGLHIGTRPSNLDKIYLVLWDWEDSPVYLTSDIFEFASQLYVEEDRSNFDIDNIQNYNQLIKRWGDEHWTISSK